MLKFSFSVPVLNSERYLDACLKSIREQNYPKDLVEILVVDAGSKDNTLQIAQKYETSIYDNPRIIGEYGMKIAVAHATGDLLVLFAADNGLPHKNWLKMTQDLFTEMPKLSAMWGGALADKRDPPINQYYELIQSEPLAYFLNKNLNDYLKRASHDKKEDFFCFDVDSQKPLCWGANGLVYRMKNVKDIFLREGYIGDNEVFQAMVEKGYSQVVYAPRLATYHHTVDSLLHWIRKWKRNYSKIFLPTRKERQIDWFYTGHFRLKMLFWICYSLNPLISIPHSLYLVWRDRNFYWMYHPITSFCQTIVYLYYSLVLPDGRKVIIETLRGQFLS